MHALNRKLLGCAVALGFGIGCNSTEQAAAVQELEPALRAYVLDEVPSDVDNRTFVDFGGKVHLVGYKVEPASIVRPGDTFKLTLYWRSVAPLSQGWGLFTHLTSPRGRLDNPDNIGPLRDNASGEQALPPSRWQPGKVYVDEQSLTMPRNISDPVVTVTVGIWKGTARLDIRSGRADSDQRAVIAHIRTGLVAPKPVAKKAEPSAETR
jgi:hypothetical protein